MHSAWLTALYCIMQQAWKGDESKTLFCSPTFHANNLTHHEETQPRGELLLGLLTLLTTHHVYAEGQQTQEQP